MTKKKLKILIFSWRGPGHPHAGGAELVTHQHAKAWVKKGHKVTLFTSSFPNSKEKEQVEGVDIVRKGNQILSVQWEAYKWYLFQNRETFDLVIDQFHGLPFFTPLFVKSRKLAFIHEVTKEVWRYNVLKEPFHTLVSLIGQLGEKWIFRLFYSNVLFWTVSKSTKNELIEFGVRNSNIYVIDNGVSVVKVKKSTRKPVLTFIGALAADKGIEDAIQVFASLKKLNLSFWIIGRYDLEYFTKLQMLVKSFKLEKKVKFWGYVSEIKKFQLLSKSYLVINPSIREGWGLTVIEAASVGTPTIAYPVSGLKDAIINEKTGLLTRKISINEMSELVKRLIENKKLYLSLQKNSKKWALNFNWDKSTAESSKLIEKIGR